MTNDGLVLALYMTTRDFAHVLFEGPLSPIDWGVKEVPGPKKSERCLESIVHLVRTHRPDVLVIEDYIDPQSHRSRRIRRLNASIQRWAEEHRLEIHRYSRTQVRETFEKFGALTKDQIAEAIAKYIPALEHRRPPIRRPWMSEDSRMGLFDATALAFAFYRFGPHDS